MCLWAYLHLNKKSTRHAHAHTGTNLNAHAVKWESSHHYYCTANGETEAKEPFCKIIDNSCLEDALVGSPWMPQAKRATEREHAIIREQTV